TDETLASPRMNLAWRLGASSVVRAAWGRVNQSQRPYELQVEDGETAFHEVEKSENRLLGFEHLFSGANGGPGVALRLELYSREIRNPLPRYENLFEPINNFQEVEPDRVLIAAERAFSEGLEVFLRRGDSGRFGWWANYAWSTTEDEIDGRRSPRSFDQTHAFNLDLDFRLATNWTLNLAWRYHTGWPTTALTVQEVPGAGGDDQGSTVDAGEDDGDGEFVPVLGRRFGERLPDYHRLDLRASRSWDTRSGSVIFFVDVQNVYNRSNVAGFDFEIEDDGTLVTTVEEWPKILPSIGVSFEF
ncbi:MAG: TonB-dependent receptor, partial [Acidobacteria bacterium]|nr:TonB-dependent receptor [Acidobacteriota bacterium]